MRRDLGGGLVALHNWFFDGEPFKRHRTFLVGPTSVEPNGQLIPRLKLQKGDLAHVDVDGWKAEVTLAGFDDFGCSANNR